MPSQHCWVMCIHFVWATLPWFAGQKVCIHSVAHSHLWNICRACGYFLASASRVKARRSEAASQAGVTFEEALKVTASVQLVVIGVPQVLTFGFISEEQPEGSAMVYICLHVHTLLVEFLAVAYQGSFRLKVPTTCGSRQTAL